ncbi:hypothetical protein Tco_0701647 [Tanacetum coccineum]
MNNILFLKKNLLIAVLLDLTLSLLVLKHLMKGKSKSTNGGQFVGPSVKKNRYEPKATTSAPKKGVTNVEDVENVYDESANLIQNRKVGGRSSFTAAAR